MARAMALAAGQDGNAIAIAPIRAMALAMAAYYEEGF
jgi:hypothetical protein